MLHRQGVTQSLARFIAETRWGDIPEGVRHEAKRALLNFFAVALAGCRAGPVEIALASLAEFSGRRQATVIGRGDRIDTLNAAFLNAATPICRRPFTRPRRSHRRCSRSPSCAA
jgi:2-methylcitrate dehydratase PrpD